MIQRIKTPMRKPLLAFALTAFLLPGGLMAQSDTGRNESERIVIIRPNAGKEKLVIEVDGDKITVNGKEVEKGSSDGVSVSRTRVRNFNTNLFNGNGSFTFSNPDAAADVIVTGYGNKAMLGVTTHTDSKGAKVASVIKGSGAEKAGLKEGDIVVRVNDAKIEKTDDISKAIRDKKVGDKVVVTYLRNGKEEKITAELSKWRGVSYSYSFDDMARSFDMNFDNIPQPPSPPETIVRGFATSGEKIGLSVQDTDDGKGVKVLSVEDESAAEKAGIREDDVILEVDNKTITNTTDITSEIRGARKKISVPVKIQRNGKIQTIDLRMPRKIRTADL